MFSVWRGSGVLAALFLCASMSILSAADAFAASPLLATRHQAGLLQPVLAAAPSQAKRQGPAALQMVAAGHMYVPKEVVTNTGWTPANAMSRMQPARATSRDPRSLGLTGRQCDVLRLILRGLPNKLICRELDLAEGTVKIHVSAVLRALGARNRTQAVIAANQLGLKLATEPV